jgi:ABC-type dipeptide/oligopeptide/nickel transport system permease subunit
MAKEKTESYRSVKRFFKIFFSRGWVTKISFGIIVAFVFVAIFAPFLTKYSPLEQDLFSILAPPSKEHWLGCDNIGRDTLTRLLYGARVSLVTGLLSSIWAAVVGTTIGLAAGYLGGWVNTAVMRLTDAMIAIPPIIFTMVLSTMVTGNLLGISIVIGVSIIPSYIRMVNGLVISLRENDYITAAVLIRQKKHVIMFRHLLPNCLASLIVTFTMNVGTAIMLESTLSYLGVGIIPPTPAWGVMVSEGYKYLFNQPLVAILPGICIMLVVIAFNIVGDALRDAMDPRLRGKL